MAAKKYTEKNPGTRKSGTAVKSGGSVSNEKGQGAPVKSGQTVSNQKGNGNTGNGIDDSRAALEQAWNETNGGTGEVRTGAAGAPTQVPVTGTSGYPQLQQTGGSQDDLIDYTAQAQAQTAADADAQDSRTRLWQSLDYAYNRQREQTGKEYDKAISQADMTAQSRGMGRSSYNIATMANMGQEKADALNDITSAQIADYQNRVTQLEQQELENERWEREFAANREDTAWSQNFQQSQADRSQGNWEQEFAANRSDTAWQQDFSERQLQMQEDQWREQFDYTKMTNDQQKAFNVITTAAANGKNVSDELLAQAGISRKDYNAMKKSASGGGGRRNNNNNNNNNNDNNNNNENGSNWLNDLFGYDTGHNPGSSSSANVTYDPTDLARRGLGLTRTQSTK